MLTGIYGYCGSGKNVFATIDAFYTPKEIPIYVNFELRLKNAERIEPEEVFEVFEYDAKVPIKKMITDEAYSWFESRGSGQSDINTFLSYLMFQSRKRGLNWMSIAQLRASLDLRWRGMEDRIVLAEERNLDISGDSKENFGYWLLKNNRKKHVTIKYEKAKPFFDLYETKEVVIPIEFKEMQLKMKNRKLDNLNDYIDELVVKLITASEKKKIIFPTKIVKDDTVYHFTQEWVRDALIKINENGDYCSNVKVRLLEKLNS